MNAITIIFLVISSSQRKTISFDHKDFEITPENASVFLDTSSDDGNDGLNFDKREWGKDCVACKFNINPCCKPNVCIKKRFRPDECMEIKSSHNERDVTN